MTARVWVKPAVQFCLGKNGRTVTLGGSVFYYFVMVRLLLANAGLGGCIC